MEVCEGIAFVLQTENASSGYWGLSYQWEISVDKDIWEEIDGAESKSYSVSEGIDTETHYRLVVTCEAGYTDTSDTLTVSLKSGAECYCIPESLFGCEDDDLIS